jgi:hypothetical protein
MVSTFSRQPTYVLRQLPGVFLKFIGCLHECRAAVLWQVWHRILGQANNSEGEIALTCIGVQYTILYKMFEICLQILQNSIACFQELYLSCI